MLNSDRESNKVKLGPLGRLYRWVTFCAQTVGFVQEFLIILGTAIEIQRLKSFKARIQADMGTVEADPLDPPEGATAPDLEEIEELCFYGWRPVVWDEDNEGVWIVGSGKN
jgi:hypothetical protein